MNLNNLHPAVNTIIIHKDDEGRIDTAPILYDDNHKEFTMKSALRYMKKHKLAPQDFRSGWFATTTVAVARAKWAIC